MQSVGNAFDKLSLKFSRVLESQRSFMHALVNVERILSTKLFWCGKNHKKSPQNAPIPLPHWYGTATLPTGMAEQPQGRCLRTVII